MKKAARKFSIILLVAVLAVSLLAACGGGGNGSSAPATSGSASAAAGGDGDVFRVGIVTDQGIDQSEWLQNLSAGLKEFTAANEGVEVNMVEATEVQDFEPKLRTLAEGGYDLIISMYSDMAEQTVAVAADYPDIMFGSMDGSIPDLESKTNIQEFGLDRLETAFIAGVAAAASSESGKVGIVAGADEPVINSIVAGWQQGLVYVNPDIEDFVVYANSFTDPTIGKEHGLALVNKGCDVIAAAAGGTGVGTAQAAAEAGVNYVAWDTHYPEVFADEQLELGSALNDFSVMMIHFISETVAGNYTPGVRVNYGMATGACSFDIPSDSPISDEARAKVEEVIAKIQAGEIEISAEPLHK